MLISAEGKETLSLLEKKIVKNALYAEEIIAFPTDTVYGIGVNGLSRISLTKIYKVKEREKEKPLTLFLDSIEKISDYIEEPDLAKHEILKKYWPGPLTAVFEKKKNLSLYFSKEESKTIGIRIPNFSLILDLLAFCKIPLVTTSANVSGESPLKSGFEIEKVLNSKEPRISVIIDYGDLPEREVSTIVAVTKDGIKVLREGILRIIEQ